jgi:hypothetical protein
LIKSRHNPAKALEEKADAESFIAFQKWFDDSVGKSVTVVVQKAERTNIFTFTVK